MAAHGMKRARPGELVPGTVSVITARLDYLPPTTAPGWQAIEWRRLDQPETAAVSIYARGRDYHKVLRQRLRPARRSRRRWRSGRSAIASSPTRRRCSRSSSRPGAASAGAASTRWRSTATPARCSSSARSSSTSPCPRATPVGRPLRPLHGVHRHLPDAGDRRALRARRAPLHLVPDDRAQGRDPGRVPRRDRQPHLRLRRLPARSAPGTSSRARARSPTSTSAPRSTRPSC